MWGIWGFFGKVAMERKMAPLSIFLTEVLVSVGCAIPILLMLWRKQNSVPLSISWNIFGILSGAGLAFGLLSYYFTLEKGQASIVIPLTAIYPAVSVLLSFTILGERPSSSQWVGISLVIVGAILLLAGPHSNIPQK